MITPKKVDMQKRFFYTFVRKKQVILNKYYEVLFEYRKKENFLFSS